MRAPKFGKINLTTIKVTFGLLAVCSMKCAALCPPSEHPTWTCSIKRFWVVNILPSHLLTLMNFNLWSLPCLRSFLKRGPHVNKFYKCPKSSKFFSPCKILSRPLNSLRLFLNPPPINRMWQLQQTTTSWKLSMCHKIWINYLNCFRRVSTRQAPNTWGGRGAKNTLWILRKVIGPCSIHRIRCWKGILLKNHCTKQLPQMLVAKNRLKQREELYLQKLSLNQRSYNRLRRLFCKAIRSLEGPFRMEQVFPSTNWKQEGWWISKSLVNNSDNKPKIMKAWVVARIPWTE